jgi:hypothetical protein
MGTALRELNKCLRNMIFMRKLKGVYTLNSMEALGLIPSVTSDHAEDEERVIALWGPDPVHPTSSAYRVLAAKIAEKAREILAENSAKEAQSATAKRKAEPRDPWIEQSQAIAKRLDARSSVRGTGRGTGRGTTRGTGGRGVRPPHRPFRGRGWWHRGQRRGN